MEEALEIQKVSVEPTSERSSNECSITGIELLMSAQISQQVAEEPEKSA